MKRLPDQQSAEIIRVQNIIARLPAATAKSLMDDLESHLGPPVERRCGLFHRDAYGLSIDTGRRETRIRFGLQGDLCSPPGYRHLRVRQRHWRLVPGLHAWEVTQNVQILELCETELVHVISDAIGHPLAVRVGRQFAEETIEVLSLSHARWLELDNRVVPLPYRHLRSRSLPCSR